MWRWLCIATLALGAAGSAAAQSTQPTHAERLRDWLAGEWNNNEQVWQHRIDTAAAAAPAASASAPARSSAPAPAHVHTRVLPVDVPALGPGVLWVAVARGDVRDPMLEAATLWQIGSAQAADGGAVRLRAWALRPAMPMAATAPDAPPDAERLRSLSQSELAHDSGCDLLLRFDAAAQAYVGGTEGARCAERALRPGQLLLREVTVRITENSWSLRQTLRDAAGALAPLPQPAEQRSRKVRFFEGWVWFRNAGPGAAADDKDTSFTAKFRLHNEGQRLVLLRKDGSESPWMLELAALTYQNTRRAILKLTLIERASGKSLSYTWANPEATTLGLNLGWFQAGLTQRAGELQRYGY